MASMSWQSQRSTIIVEPEEPQREGCGAGGGAGAAGGGASGSAGGATIPKAVDYGRRGGL
eukprot:7020168-Prymnesium_polylepis.2